MMRTNDSVLDALVRAQAKISTIEEYCEHIQNIYLFYTQDRIDLAKEILDIIQNE